MSTLPRLLPCPFCSKTPILIKHFKLDDHYSLVHRCEVIGLIILDFGNPSTHAISWNTRAAQAAEVEALRGLLKEARKIIRASSSRNLVKDWEARATEALKETTS